MPTRDAPAAVLSELADRPRQIAQAGTVAAPPAWSAAGDRVAVCGADERTSLVTLDGGVEEVVDGCWPAFDAAAAVITRKVIDPEASEHVVLRDGEAVLEGDELLRNLPLGSRPPAVVLGHTTARSWS